MNKMPFILLVVLVVALSACGFAPSDHAWSVYGGHASGDRYSELKQITPANVRNLKLAWRFDTGGTGESQTHPLVIGRTLFGYTPDLKVIALDAATGALRWTFDASTRGAAAQRGMTFGGPARGFAYWIDGRESRLFAGVGSTLYALDPATGDPVDSFGEAGAIDLRRGLNGDLSITTPGIVYRNLLIVGFRTAELPPAAAGNIRAYDVRTGQLQWDFHTIPRPGETGYDTWPQESWKNAGAANVWAGFALDEKRGIVYAPTGSAVPDFYGADRIGDNLFANTLLALDAATGKRLWHFQAVRHDIWDRDFPSPPSLVTVTRHGKRIDAVAQTTKHGFVYLFDRVTGAPLFPIVERKVSASSTPGEIAAQTQPFPTAPAPFARQLLTQEDLTTRTPAAHAWAMERFQTFISAGQFVPFSLGKQTVVFPGFDGGAEWGGAAVDPRSGVIYINSNDIAWTGGLTENKSEAMSGVAGLYRSQCAACHGIDRTGSPPAFPSLLEAHERLGAAEIEKVIRSGKGRMPPFTVLPAAEVQQLIEYLRTGNDASETSAKREMVSSQDEVKPVPYTFTGYRKFLDPEGYPAVAPPWGTLNAIDLNTGKYVWKIPLGEYPQLAAQGMSNTGSENYGGPIVTASGLLFIGATIFDRKLRAFDSRTGELLWSVELPFAGTATPITYAVDGKQYVAIVTSNARNPRAPQGSAYVAFALPD